ncbi:MAG: hypothetical protein ACOCVF_03645 [bacterium]
MSKKVNAIISYPVYVEIDLDENYDLNEELHRENLINEVKDKANELFNKASIDPEVISILVDGEKLPDMP